MKVFFIILILYISNTTYNIKKIPVEMPENMSNFYCDQAFENNAIWKDNPLYKAGNDEVWGNYTFNNQIIIAHFCKDHKGNYVL